MRWRYLIDKAKKLENRLIVLKNEIDSFADELKTENKVYQSMAAETAQELYGSMHKMKELCDQIENDYMIHPTHYKFRNSNKTSMKIDNEKYNDVDRGGNDTAIVRDFKT